MLRHRRLLAFVLTAAAAVGALSTLRPSPPVTSPVPVAAHDLAAGAVIGPGDLAVADLPPGAVPDGVTTPALGTVLAGPIRRGEPVTDVRLVGPALSAMQPGVVAMPVRLSDGAMVALLHVGDRLHLLTTDPASGRTTSVADRVIVLAAPPVEDAQNGVMNRLAGRLVVVGIPEDLVATVTSASVRGFLSFAYDD